MFVCTAALHRNTVQIKNNQENRTHQCVRIQRRQMRLMSMIARHWKGLAKPGEAENYIDHLKTETFPKLSEINGFIEASILRREVDRGTEFLIITTWESMEAIERFAGATANVAVVPAVAQAMMIEYDGNVSHYEIIESYKPA